MNNLEFRLNNLITATELGIITVWQYMEERKKFMSAENKLALLQDLLIKERCRNRPNPSLIADIEKRIKVVTNRLRGLV